MYFGIFQKEKSVFNSSGWITSNFGCGWVCKWTNWFPRRLIRRVAYHLRINRKMFKFIDLLTCLQASHLSITFLMQAQAERYSRHPQSSRCICVVRIECFKVSHRIRALINALQWACLNLHILCVACAFRSWWSFDLLLPQSQYDSLSSSEIMPKP